jgi:hypothetical protein
MRQEAVLEVLNDPLARKLMASAIPARLAYNGTDGFPRVVPIAFHWDGARFVLATATDAPKVRALPANPQVALTIDTNEMPPEVLLVRGTATVDVVDGVPPEFLEGNRKLVDAAVWDEFEAQTRATYDRMARIIIVPEWAKLLDFETRVPEAIERIAERRGRGSERP